jgi:hypothetical protein
VNRGPLNGTFGDPWGALWGLWGSWGDPGVSLGDPWGLLWVAWVGLRGVNGGAWEKTLGKQAALQQRWFYCLNDYIWAVRRGLEEAEGGEFESKTGGKELDWDRGAYKKTKTKRAGADEEKKGLQGHSRGSSIIDLALPPAEVHVLLT